MATVEIDMMENVEKLKALQEKIEGLKGKTLVGGETQEIIDEMRNLYFFVPVNFGDEEMLKKIEAEMKETGKPVQINPNEAKPLPILVQNGDNEAFLSAYTGMDQIPSHVKRAAVINMPFEALMHIAQSPEGLKQVQGIVVNAFTSNFVMRMNRQMQVTPEQFHKLVRQNIERVLLPKGIYTGTKEDFDKITTESVLEMFKSNYRENIEFPYTEEDINVMQLGVKPEVDLLSITFPSKNFSQGCAERAFGVWNKETGKSAYYLIVKGENGKRFMYVSKKGEGIDLGEAPIESNEINTVLENYENQTGNNL